MWESYNLISNFRTRKTIKKSVTDAVKGTVDTVMPKVTVKEIHETFYTEADRLLESAKIKPSVAIDEDLLEKSERARNLGFYSCKHVEDSKVQESLRDAVLKENVRKKEMVRAINYFSQKYPMYKFITESSVKEICRKYGLIYGTVNRYIGTIPDKNLDHMESFSIDPYDECWEERFFSTVTGFERTTMMSKEEADKKVEHWYGSSSALSAEGMVQPSMFNTRLSNPEVSYKPSLLEIAAPKEDFNTAGMKIEDSKLVTAKVPDPVVLKPVWFEKVKYYLIVTAWGDEAEDELVNNPKHN